MKLHSQAFEDDLIGEVRERLRARPKLLAGRRHMEKRRTVFHGANWLHFMILFWMPMSLQKHHDPEGASVGGLVLFSLWMLALSMVYVGKITAGFESHADIFPMMSLPAEDGLIYRWISQKSLERSWWLLLFSGTGCLVLLPPWGDFVFWMVATVLIWLGSVGAAWLAFRYLTPSQSAYVAFAAGAIIGLSLLFESQIGRERIHSFLSYIGLFALWLPTGWGIQLANPAFRESVWLMAAVIGVGTFGLCYLAFHAWRSLSEGYVLTPWDNYVPSVAEEELPMTKVPEMAGGAPVPRSEPVSQFQLRPPELSPSDVWERLYLRWLTPEERQVANAAISDSLGWVGLWKLGLKVACVMGLLVFASKHYFPGLSVMIALILGMWCAFTALPWGIEFSSLFSDRWQGQLLTALHGILPVSLWHVSRAMWKAAVLRLVMALPLIWLASGMAYLSTMEGGNYVSGWLVPGSWLALKILLIIVSLQTLVPTVWFLRAGQFSRRKLRNYVGIAVSCLLGVIIVGAGCGLLIGDQGDMPFTFAVLLVSCSLFALLNQFFYLRGKIDLVRQSE